MKVQSLKSVDHHYITYLHLISQRPTEILGILISVEIRLDWIFGLTPPLRHQSKYLAELNLNAITGNTSDKSFTIHF